MCPCALLSLPKSRHTSRKVTSKEIAKYSHAHETAKKTKQNGTWTKVSTVTFLAKGDNIWLAGKCINHMYTFSLTRTRTININIRKIQSTEVSLCTRHYLVWQPFLILHIYYVSIHSNRSLLAKLVPTFVDRGCHVIDPYGRNLGFLDRSHYFFFQVAPQLYSRGLVDSVPDQPLLRKSGSARNRTRTSGSVARNFDH
jgi:hypothetical protein